MLRNLSNLFSMGYLGLIITFVTYALILFVALPFHEFAHAYIAYKMGDNTAKWNGRLSMNPLKHLDVVGSLMIVFLGFGYAKPVPVNPRNFRNYKLGMFLTSLAGPLSNILLATVSIILRGLLDTILPEYIVFFFDLFAQINVSLAIFNLLPIPPLDGYRIFSNILPRRWTYFVDQYQFYISIGLMVLIFANSSIITVPLGFLSEFVLNVLYNVFSW